MTSQCAPNLAPQEKEGHQGNHSFLQEQNEKVQSHHLMANRWGNNGRLYFGGLQMVTATMKLKDTPWKESYDQPRQHIKKQRHYFVNKGPSS